MNRILLKINGPLGPFAMTSVQKLRRALFCTNHLDLPSLQICEEAASEEVGDSSISKTQQEMCLHKFIHDDSCMFCKICQGFLWFQNNLPALLLHEWHEGGWVVEGQTYLLETSLSLTFGAISKRLRDCLKKDAPFAYQYQTKSTWLITMDHHGPPWTSKCRHSSLMLHREELRVDQHWCSMPRGAVATARSRFGGKKHEEPMRGQGPIIVEGDPRWNHSRWHTHRHNAAMSLRSHPQHGLRKPTKSGGGFGFTGSNLAWQLSFSTSATKFTWKLAWTWLSLGRSTWSVLTRKHSQVEPKWIVQNIMSKKYTISYYINTMFKIFRDDLHLFLLKFISYYLYTV